MSETRDGRWFREEADKAWNEAISNSKFRAGMVIALIALVAAVREQTQVMREANGV